MERGDLHYKGYRGETWLDRGEEYLRVVNCAEELRGTVRPGETPEAALAALVDAYLDQCRRTGRAPSRL